MAYMTIFSRMHSRWAGLKLGYFNRATNSIGTLFICWLYMRQKYVRGRRRCDRGRCKTPSPRANAESRRNTAESPIADARRRRGRERRERRPRGSRRRRCLDGSGLLRLVSPGAKRLAGRGPMFRDAAKPLSRRRRMRARECVLCDEYAYIRAKRGRRRIGFAGSAGRNPTGARERRIFRGDALLAGEAWPAASPFGAPDRAHMYMWRFLATACAGSEPSVSVHVAKARIELR